MSLWVYLLCGWEFSKVHFGSFHRYNKDMPTDGSLLHAHRQRRLIVYNFILPPFSSWCGSCRKIYECVLEGVVSLFERFFEHFWLWFWEERKVIGHTKHHFRRSDQHFSFKRAFFFKNTRLKVLVWFHLSLFLEIRSKIWWPCITWVYSQSIFASNRDRKMFMWYFVRLRFWLLNKRSWASSRGY